MLKRKRSQNFTIDEKDRLIKILLFHKGTILNKKTDGTTNDAKASAWTEVTNSFNTCGGIYRTKESLMKIWEKMKSESKIYYTAARKDITPTGGGPPVIKTDFILEQVCSILGRGCTGIIGVPDSDASDSNTGIIKIPEEPESHFKVQILDEEGNSQITQNAKDTIDITCETPLWSRRQPVFSQINERTEAVSSLCNSFKEVNKKKEDIEDLKRQLLIEEIEFKRKLYELQLQSAQKEVEIKEEVLRQIRGGVMNLGSMFSSCPPKD